MQIFGNTIRFNVQATTTRWTFAQYLDNWKRCEQLGYDVTYATDHFVSYSAERGPTSVLESTTLISAMASNTTRMRCGIMVAGNTFRNPGILAKTAVTLDNISGGRLELGMGSGHTLVEHEQYNIPYYTQGRRIRMLGEAVKIVRSFFDNERTSFAGKYYQIENAVCEPKPIQRPMPILIGGIGEDLSMRIVAESADIWNNWTSPDLEAYQQKLNALHRHCQDVGRDSGDIRKSMHIKPLIGESESEVEEMAKTSDRHRSQGTPEQVAEDLLSFVELGVSDFVFMLDYPGDFRTLELLATQVAPYVRERGSALLNGAVTANR